MWSFDHYVVIRLGNMNINLIEHDSIISKGDIVATHNPTRHKSVAVQILQLRRLIDENKCNVIFLRRLH